MQKFEIRIGCSDEVNEIYIFVQSSPPWIRPELQKWGFRQCLPFSWTTLRGKYSWHPIAVMEVADTFGHSGAKLLLEHS